MTSKQSKQAAAAPQPAWDIPRGYFHTVWSVTGRGKSTTYCALMPHGLGEPGQRVALVARSGAVTLARLTGIHDMGDASSAGNRWDFERETIAPEQQAANRAAKAASTASYWQSSAGIATAERIAQRTASKQQQSEPASTEPASEPSEQQSEPTAAPDDIATTVAMLIAGGMSASDAASVGVAMRAAQSAQPTAPQPTAPQQRASKQSKQQSPRASKQSAQPARDVAERCDACNRERKGCAEHAGASELIVCPRCATLDTDTARVRAARHSS